MKYAVIIRSEAATEAEAVYTYIGQNAPSAATSGLWQKSRGPCSCLLAASFVAPPQRIWLQYASSSRLARGQNPLRVAARDCGRAGLLPQAARWYNQLIEAVFSLEDFPRRYPLAAECDYFNREIRVMMHGAYRILYVVHDDPPEVSVLRIRHGARLRLGEEADD